LMSPGPFTELRPELPKRFLQKTVPLGAGVAAPVKSAHFDVKEAGATAGVKQLRFRYCSVDL